MDWARADTKAGLGAGDGVRTRDIQLGKRARLDGAARSKLLNARELSAVFRGSQLDAAGGCQTQPEAVLRELCVVVRTTRSDVMAANFIRPQRRHARSLDCGDVRNPPASRRCADQREAEEMRGAR